MTTPSEPPAAEVRTAVVSGAAGGIGAAITRRLAEAGSRVIELDQPGADVADDRAPARRTERADLVRADLRSPSEVASAIEAIQRITRHVDLLVNCAARQTMKSPLETTLAEFDAVMAVNVRAAWQLTVGLMPLLLAGDGRAVVNIGSTHPHQTKLGSFPYNVSKGALLALTKALAVDLGQHGIRVNSVLPGFVATPAAQGWVEAQPDPAETWQAITQAHPGGRIPTAEDVAEAVLFLASPGAAGISGTELFVDGGRHALRP